MRLWAEHPGCVPVLKSVPAATARPPKLTPSRRGAPRPTDETNSVVRALALYRTRLAQRDGGSLAVPRFRAHLAKALPIDAGLVRVRVRVRGSG